MVINSNYTSSMKRFFKYMHAFFSRKSSSVLITIICIAAKSLLIFFYTYTGKDKIYNLSASYNLLHDKGWTNSFYYADNINQEVLLPFCHWPPGYGLIFTPFLAIFGENIYLATAILEVLCFTAFTLLCRGILATQNVSRVWINISTILLSFFSHDFIEASLGTDLLALAFLLGFFYCSLLIWNGAGSTKLKWLGFAAGLCLFFSGFTRYMYVPVGIFIALLLPGIAYWKKHRVALPALLITAITSIGGLVLAMIIQDAACGSPFYTGIKEQGIFWRNVSDWHPAVLASFTDLKFVPVQLAKVSGISYVGWLKIFNWVNWILYAWIAIALIRYLIEHWKSSAGSFPIFELLGAFLAAAIIGELALLSLTNGLKYTMSNDAWTFIVEGRYHAFPVVFFQLFLLKKIAGIERISRPRSLYQAIFISCFLLFVFNSLHQVYFTVKVGLNYSKMKEASVREQDYVFFERLLKATRRENPGKDILVASDDKYYTLLASMLQAKGIADPVTLNDRIPVTGKPSVLLVIFYGNKAHRYTGYLQNNDARLIKEVAGTRFYVQLLPPQSKNDHATE